MRSFDPRRVGSLECDAWVTYYRREWLKFLRAAISLTRQSFGLRWPATLWGAWLVLRANQLWAPYPGNDPDGARRCMRRPGRAVRPRLPGARGGRAARGGAADARDARLRSLGGGGLRPDQPAGRAGAGGAGALVLGPARGRPPLGQAVRRKPRERSRTLPSRSSAEKP